MSVAASAQAGGRSTEARRQARDDHVAHTGAATLITHSSHQPGSHPPTLRAVRGQGESQAHHLLLGLLGTIGWPNICSTGLNLRAVALSLLLLLLPP
jgi:hypothetical protein